MTAHQDALDPDLGVMPIPETAVEAGIRDHLVVIVEDVPVPQGSKKKVGRGIFIDDNKDKLEPWREAVKGQARHSMREMHGDCWPQPLFPRGVPVRVEITFTFARTGAHFGSGRNAAVLKPGAPSWHVVSPDVDKLARAVADALTAAGVWDDDKQMCELVARKCYPGGHHDSLRIPGAVIRIRAVAP